jgi:hypothetical protein
MRVRHYGFLANAVREKQLQTIREDLRIMPATDTSNERGQQPVSAQSLSGGLCPKCKTGHLIRTLRLPRPRLEGG